MKGKTVWVVIADGARARIFAANQAGRNLRPALGYELVGDRRHGRDIVTDRPGRTKDRAAQGRHAMEPPTDPHEQQEIALARELAHLLDEARRKREFDELAIIAEPRMLGRIREFLPHETRKTVRAEVPKDLSRLDLRELEERVPQLI